MASQFINLKSRLLNPYVVFAVWMLCTVWICITQSLAGPQNYNNFLVFRGVFDHLFSSLPLYEPYPLEYGDINHYGPIFAFIIAPFAVLPPWLGMSLWCMSLSLLLYWTVRQLPMPVVLTSLVLWLTLNDFYGACFKQQFNIAVAALVVGALAMIEKRREGWAALFIVIGTFVKIYGIVGLAFFFFVRRKGRFIGYMALWSAMALLLPCSSSVPNTSGRSMRHGPPTLCRRTVRTCSVPIRTSRWWAVCARSAVRRPIPTC